MKSASKTSIDGTQFGRLLTPSWLGGIAVTLISAGACLGVLLNQRYQSSSFRLDFIHYDSPILTQYNNRVVGALSRDTFISNLPLLMFWGLVGLIVYLFTARLLAIVRSTAELGQTVNFVHANHRRMLEVLVVHLSIRLAAAFAWWAYSLFFFRVILPYCLAASLVGASQINGLHNSLYALLAIATLAIALHVFVILGRLLLLKSRLFGTSFASV